MISLVLQVFGMCYFLLVLISNMIAILSTVDTFSGWLIFIVKYSHVLPGCIYPFHWWWTFELFPSSGSDEKGCQVELCKSYPMVHVGGGLLGCRVFVFF